MIEIHEGKARQHVAAVAGEELQCLVVVAHQLVHAGTLRAECRGRCAPERRCGRRQLLRTARGGRDTAGSGQRAAGSGERDRSGPGMSCAHV